MSLQPPSSGALRQGLEKKVRAQCYGLGGGGSCLRHVARKASPKRAERPVSRIEEETVCTGGLEVTKHGSLEPKGQMDKKGTHELDLETQARERFVRSVDRRS